MKKSKTYHKFYKDYKAGAKQARNPKKNVNIRNFSSKRRKAYTDGFSKETNRQEEKRHVENWWD